MKTTIWITLCMIFLTACSPSLGKVAEQTVSAETAAALLSANASPSANNPTSVPTLLPDTILTSTPAATLVPVTSTIDQNKTAELLAMDSSDNSNLDKIKELIAAGADVNAKDEGGYPTLWAAAFFGNVELIELLLQNGADPNLSVSSGDLNDGTVPLHALGMERDPNYMINNVEIARLLVEYGADVNFISSLRFTPIEVAASSRMNDLTAYLKENGGEANCEPNKGFVLAHDLCDISTSTP